MTIPTYDALILPVLKFCAERAWLMKDLVVRVADDLGLSPEDRERQIPSGGTSIIASRVHWAKTYLKQAGLVDQPKRGVVQISAKGREVLQRDPVKIDSALLQQFDQFRSFLGRTKAQDGSVSVAPPAALLQASSTPEEQITTASRTLEETLKDALLARILEG